MKSFSAIPVRLSAIRQWVSAIRLMLSADGNSLPDGGNISLEFGTLLPAEEIH